MDVTSQWLVMDLPVTDSTHRLGGSHDKAFGLDDEYYEQLITGDFQYDKND